MKKYFSLTLLFLNLYLFCLTYEVDPSDVNNYNSIQSAINQAVIDGGNAEIIVKKPLLSNPTYIYYENLDINFQTNTNLASLSINAYTPNTTDEIVIESLSNVVNVISVSGRLTTPTSFTIENFTITNGLCGINISDNFLNPAHISRCKITDNFTGIFCEDTMLNILDCEIINNTYKGIVEAWNALQQRDLATISNCLIADNGDNGISVEECWDIVNCTIVNNNGIGISGIGDIEILNCIIYYNNQQIGSSNSYDVRNSNVQNGYSGSNIDLEPRFIDPINGNYSLRDDSPCIDAGNSNIYVVDPDGTRKDLGYKYVNQNNMTANRSLKSGWNWICFPRLKRVDGVGIYINTSTFGTAKFLGHLWDVTVTGAYPYQLRSNSSIIEYDPPLWDNENYVIESIQGFKLEMSGSATESQIGALESPDTEVTMTNLNTKPYYVGYILADSGLITEVVPTDMLQYEFQIQAQHWCATYNPNIINGWRFDTTSEPTIKCGEMVAIKIRNAPNGEFTFQWREPQTTRVETDERPMPEYFSFIEQEDYLPVFLELDCNNLPQEIGLYIDGECKGAAVVNQNQTEEAICQINAYILEETEANWQEELEIVYYYGARATNKVFNKFAVYDQQNSEYYDQNLILADMLCKDYVTISMRGGSYEETPKTDFDFRSHNYPNPFNPTTDIYFSLPASADTSLEIYNVKGQKVRTLINGNLEQGEYQITWDGTDSNCSSVSSGIYFYRLQSGKNVINQKVTLMK